MSAIRMLGCRSQGLAASQQLLELLFSTNLRRMIATLPRWPPAVVRPQAQPNAGSTRHRWLSEGLRTETGHFPEQLYHQVADHTMESLVEKLEAYVEELDFDGDVEYSQGVLTVRLGSRGTYVINKQTPNRQIWMSSPVSGPVRYNFDGGRWVYSRDRHDLVSRLQQELPALCGKDIDLGGC